MTNIREARSENILRDTAALLLAMNRENSTNILKQFSTDEITEVAKIVMNLGQVYPDELESIIERFESELRATPPIEGSEKSTIELISSSLPKNTADDVLSSVLGLKKSIWDEMQKLPSEVVAQILKCEHPQTIAYIVTQCEQTYAASFLQHLDPELRSQVVLGTIHAHDPGPIINSILNDAIEEAIAQRSSMSPNQKSIDSVAAILNTMPQVESKAIIEDIAKSNPRMLKDLELRMFSFEDLSLLSNEKLKQVLDTIPSDKLAVALQSMPEDFCEVILSGLGLRARRMVEAELNSGNISSGRDIDKSRKFIVDSVLKIRRDSIVEA